MSDRQGNVFSQQWSEQISDMCALDLVIRKEKISNIKELKGGNNFFYPEPVLQETPDNAHTALPDTIGLDDKVTNMPRRNPTEGSNSKTIMTTISGLCNHPNAERRFMNKIHRNKTRSINLTTTADKFLFGTMDALSQREEMAREEKGMSLDRSLCVQTHSHDTNFRFLENDGSQNCQTTAQSGYYPTLSISMVSGSIETHTSDSSEMPNLDRTANATQPDGQVHEQSSSSKRSPTNRSSRPPLLPPCRVCGDRASGYHYGVNTCEACKGFFRRSICKTEPYVCNGSGDCKTIAGKRTACSHCRFKRCIEVGMSKNAIKTGRYTHELRSKNIMEVKRLQKQQSDDSTGSSEDASVELRSGEGLYTEYKRDLFKRTLLEETLNVLVEGQKLLSEFLDDYYNDQLIKERQMGVYNAYLLKKKKMEDKIKESTLVLSTTCHLDENIPTDSVNDGDHYKAVSLKRTQHDPLDDITNDAERLKREGPGDTTSSIGSENRHSNSSISNNIQCDEVGNITVESDPKLLMKNDILKTEVESLKAEVMTKIIADMEQCVQGVLAFAKCLPGFDDLPKDDQASLLKASRFDIWFIGHIRCFNVELRVGACEWQFHAEELAQVWGHDLVDLAFVMSRVAQDLDLTKQETSVLRAICLTFSDRCVDLLAREKVDEINVFMLDVFRFVSCKRHNNFNKWFSRVINFLVLLREFGVKFEKVSAELKLDWSVLKDNPLLLSVFLS